MRDFESFYYWRGFLAGVMVMAAINGILWWLLFFL